MKDSAEEGGIMAAEMAGTGTEAMTAGGASTGTAAGVQAVVVMEEGATTNDTTPATTTEAGSAIATMTDEVVGAATIPDTPSRVDTG